MDETNRCLLGMGFLHRSLSPMCPAEAMRTRHVSRGKRREGPGARQNKSRKGDKTYDALNLCFSSMKRCTSWSGLLCSLYCRTIVSRCSSHGFVMVPRMERRERSEQVSRPSRCR